MNKRILKNIIFVILMSTFVILAMTISSNAASIGISTSKSSVSPGETFTVTVSVNGGAGSVTASASNGTGGKTEFLDNSSFSFSCTAGSSGSVTVRASGTVADYTTEKDENKSASKSVTIVQPTPPSTSGGNSSSGGNTTKPSTNTTKPTTNNTNKTTTETKKSTDSSLSTLSIAEGAITPEFNKDIKEYSLSVPNEITVVNLTVKLSDGKANASIEGNADLKEGENIVTITVTAEDGSTSKYIVKVTRSRPDLSLKTLIAKFKDQNGELIESKLNPIFNFETYEYTLEDLEYWVEELEIEAISNIEGATINIDGADNLVAGENTIKVTVKMPVATENAEEAVQEEIKTYTIKVNKKEAPVPPTLIGRISNWFNEIMGSVGTFYINNQKQIVLEALGLCIVALIGLSIYIIIDYKKYKMLIEKLKKITQSNNLEIVETIEETANENFENVIIESNNQNKKEESDKKAGRHF